MSIQKKHKVALASITRDMRPLYVRFGEWLEKPLHTLIVCLLGVMTFFVIPETILISDIVLFIYFILVLWLLMKDRSLPLKLPADIKYKDPHNMGPGKNGKPEGILYFGNEKDTKRELWLSNSDARTHFLYLGTTGAGKTEGLKSLVTNAMSWGSGFVYIDGKADTDLWSSLSSLVRRFGRDDDLLVLNYMTGNSDTRAPSNTMNPFSSGSASYLANMLISLMPEAEGDNAMWKERAVSLLMSIMPALTWKRDNQDMPLSVSTLRKSLELDAVIRLSKDEAVPEDLREGIHGYLATLPGYVEDAFDEEGKEKPPGPDQPMIDTTTVRQQHGYLTMQFTRSLQSLGDDYGYIFDSQDADVDMVDVVLNRRILVTLIPALEKSGDETANLGKIVAATIKGMMGSTLGATVEGESSKVIENKPTHSSTPFMTVFDEVGYYTAPGMAVMAAQARSLGFCLVFAAQDLQSMEKRVKEEARSVTANCNIKIFGKLEDPTQTKEFFENQTGKGLVMQAGGFKLSGGSGTSTGSYYDTQEGSIQSYANADYSDLRKLKEGEAWVTFGENLVNCTIFYANPGHAKAMRVTRFLSLDRPDDSIINSSSKITKLRDRLVKKGWSAMNADVAVETPAEIDIMMEGYRRGERMSDNPVDHGIAALVALQNEMFPEETKKALQKASEPAKSQGSNQNGKQSQPSSSGLSSGDSPMGVFSKDKKTQTKSSDSSSSADVITREKTPPKEQEAQGKTKEYIKQQLDKEIENIMIEAGRNIRKSIFKSSGKENGNSDGSKDKNKDE